MMLVMWIVILLVILLLIANLWEDTSSNCKYDLIYSYGLFSDDPLSNEMKRTVKHNKKVTGLSHAVLGSPDVLQDMKRVPVKNLEKAYHKIPRGVAKSDLARLIHLYVRGGHYADLDIEFHRTPVMRKGQVVLYTEKLDPFPRVANYAMSAPPKHPFILEVIRTIVRRILKIKNKEWSDKDVLSTTGPGVMTDVYRRWNHDDVARIGLINSYRILKHKSAGSWRENKDTK